MVELHSSTSVETEEEWRPIPGYEGLYIVSSHGRIMRVGKAAVHGKGRGGGARVGHIRRPWLRPDGYYELLLWKEGIPERARVHCFVALAFLGTRPDGYDINHKDGNKQHNSPDNLEYVTRSENNSHAYRIGLKTPTWTGKPSPRRKPRISILCACGCGTFIVTPDNKGRDRRFVTGHNNMSR